MGKVVLVKREKVASMFTQLVYLLLFTENEKQRFTRRYLTYKTWVRNISKQKLQNFINIRIF